MILKSVYKLNFISFTFFFKIDIWQFADKHMQITGKDGKKYDLSLACEDIIAHEKLTDEVSAPHTVQK